jgi:hypothetical protein
MKGSKDYKETPSTRSVLINIEMSAVMFLSGRSKLKGDLWQ